MKDYYSNFMYIYNIKGETKSVHFNYFQAMIPLSNGTLLMMDFENGSTVTTATAREIAEIMYNKNLIKE